MTKMKVVKDASGKVINIGPWDYGVVHQATDEVDEQGAPIMILTETNPLPDGAYVDSADVFTDGDGGLCVKDVRRSEANAAKAKNMNIKKLIWERDERGELKASCSVESYLIEKTPPSWPDDERFRLCYGQDSCGHHWGEYPTEAEAMSAAQSHLEDVVLDVLDL